MTYSAGFVDTLRFGAVLVASKLTVYSAGAPTSVTLPVSVLSVTVDRNSEFRRQGSITVQVVPSIPPPEILPINPASLLAPFGNEVFIEIGIASLPQGGKHSEVQTWVPLGLFAIATSTVDDTVTDLTVTLDVYDRSWVIAQRAFLQPSNFPATPSGNFVDEITALLNKVWGTNPPLSYNIVPTTATVPVASYGQGSDPWQAALDMANAVGYELFFDPNGVVTGYPIPNPADQPIFWNFTDDETAIYGAGGAGSGGGSAQLLGSPFSTPVATAITMTRDGIYNDVFITGTGTSNAPASSTGNSQPVLASAADTNPNSATYVNGGMGDVPQFVSTNLPTTSAQAQEMANNDLQAALSAAWQISITIPPNPTFDIDQVVTVTRPRVGLNKVKMVIDTIDYQVSYGDTCTVTGRVVPS